MHPSLFKERGGHASFIFQKLPYCIRAPATPKGCVDGSWSGFMFGGKVQLWTGDRMTMISSTTVDTIPLPPKRTGPQLHGRGYMLYSAATPKKHHYDCCCPHPKNVALITLECGAGKGIRLWNEVSCFLYGRMVIVGARGWSNEGALQGKSNATC